ncbi:MAG: hypothetical protein HGA31_00110 [Candidatus Moranbacteria bacterium]|nr:hypothetical protein [Candidatus Moranbacteria bacterium]
MHDFFLLDDPRILCEEASMLYGLSPDLIFTTTWPVADIFVREVPLSEYPFAIAKEAGIDMPAAYGIAYEVNRRIFLRFPEYFTDSAKLGAEWETKKSAPVIGLDEAKRKVFELEPWLLENAEEKETASMPMGTVSLPLLQAVSQYPKLGEQIISKDRIVIHGNPEPVRPSLANWIRAYRNDLGVGYHDPMVRGKFLFDSENGKKLSSEDRERLNLIIRSIEDNAALDIDPENSAIIFPAFHTVEKGPAPAPTSTPPVFRATAPTGAMDARQAPARPVAPEVRAPAPASLPVASITKPVSSKAPALTELTLASTQAAAVSRGLGLKSAAAVAAGIPAVPVPQPAPRRENGTIPSIRSNVSGTAFQRDGNMRPAVKENAVSKDTSGGNISFSSKHSLPVELGSDRNLSIRHDSRPSQSAPLPSAAPFNGTGNDSSARMVEPEPPRNPFHIHPVNTGSDDSSDISGRVVDLRGGDADKRP